MNLHLNSYTKTTEGFHQLFYKSLHVNKVLIRFANGTKLHFGIEKEKVGRQNSLDKCRQK